ncbi:acetylserotonin O-methyltransferase [Micromonospora okii]|uniref:acetylserotonin O-methyltransferase n=1 Tax=Micromonospora okii TaxID=1182970 RepID=UPI001E5DB55B|nr:acetylserotonin O-methyltransferase [Micromonospora okii]
MPPATTAQDDLAYERFHLIVNGPALFNAVVTGLDLGIFALLSRHAGAGPDEIEQAVRLPAHQTRVLMHALCATGLVRRSGGGYHNTRVAEDLLTSDGPGSWRHILAGWQQIYYPAYPHLTEAMLAGTNTALTAHPGTEPTLYQRLAHQPELEEVLHRSMAAFTLQTMPGLLDNPEIATVRHLLDIGGGDGTTARAFAERYPSAEVTIFDMPSVTRLAGDISDGGRVRLHPGDLFADPLPTGADAALFSHVLEVFSGEQILTLLRKAHEALPAGGRLFIYGFHASDDEDDGVYSARLSLYLNVLATGTGMTYPVGDYEQWARQAGFDSVKSYTGLPYEHGLVVATKE